MKWADGRMYKGNFKNGLEDGSVFNVMLLITDLKRLTFDQKKIFK